MPAVPDLNYDDVITETWVDTVKDNLNGVLPTGYIPRCRASLTGPLAIAAATITAVNWNSEIFDTDTIHSTSVNTSRLTVPTGMGGIWFFSYNVQFGSAGAAGDRQCWVSKNGGGARLSSTLNTTQTAAENVTNSASGFEVLVAGDYLTLNVYSAQALNVNPISIDYFEMCRIGPS